MGQDYSLCVGAVGLGGGVWHSPDGGETWKGDSWQKLKREFSEVGALAWAPN